MSSTEIIKWFLSLYESSVWAATVKIAPILYSANVVSSNAAYIFPKYNPPTF